MFIFVYILFLCVSEQFQNSISVFWVKYYTTHFFWHTTKLDEAGETSFYLQPRCPPLLKCSENVFFMFHIVCLFVFLVKPLSLQPFRTS